MDSAYKFPSSRLKTDQFFLQWLAQPENQELVWQLVEDCKKGKPLRGPVSASPTTPRSPRLAPSTIATPPLSPSKVLSSRGSSPTRRTPSFTAPETPTAAPDTPAIPRFYFPGQSVVTSEQRTAFITSVVEAFESYGGRVTPEQLLAVLPSLAGCPGFLAFSVFDRAALEGQLTLSADAFIDWWEAQGLIDADGATCVFQALRQAGADHLTSGDLLTFMQHVIRHHPGLEFLQDTAEFQERYAETVVYRIFYVLDYNGNGRIRLNDIKRSDLVDAMAKLDQEEDINKILQYFSYEHFYVMYCKFWELDQDHDFLIDKEDLSRYGGHGLTFRMVDRIFSGAPRRMSCREPGKMGYEDFVYFILSEEDKTTDASLVYWHRCVDIDDDGVISDHDMRHFYSEQLRRMECSSQVPVSFEDIWCQMQDMLNPEVAGQFSLRDLRRNRQLAGTLFNILFNLNKFVAYETRDPFVVRQEKAEDPDATDWDRFARQEYIRLALEDENADEGQMEDSKWDDAEQPSRGSDVSDHTDEKMDAADTAEPIGTSFLS